MDYSKIISNIKSLQSFNQQIYQEELISVTGAGQGEKAFMLQSLKNPAIFVSSDFVEIGEIKDALEKLGKRCDIIAMGLMAPLWNRGEDIALYNNFVKSIYNLKNNQTDVLFVLPEVILRRLPNKDKLNTQIEFEINKEYKFNEVISSLTKLGYNRCDSIMQVGDFSVRGDIIDIFALNFDNPIRLEFWGDEIENISFIDAETKKTTEKTQKITIFPSKLFNFSKNDKIETIKKLKQEINENSAQGESVIKQTLLINEICEKIENNLINFSEEYLVPYLDFNCNILNIFEGVKIFFDEPKRLVDDLKKIEQSQSASLFEFVQSGDLNKSHLNFFLDYAKALDVKNYVVFNNIQNSEFKTTKNIAIRSVGTRKYVFDYKSLINDLKIYTNSSYKVVLFAGSEDSKKSLSEFINQNGLTPSEDVYFANSKGQVVVTEKMLPLSASFLDSGVIFIGTNDLIKKSKSAPSQKSRNINAQKKNVFYLPKVGDYVVHEVHGIGKCTELTKLNLNGIEKDYFVIEYAGGDKLYLPSEQANLISALLGSNDNPKLNKIGGVEFGKIKEKVKEGINKLAVNLIEIYSAREKNKGFKYGEDEPIYEEFENAFKYAETDDQISAIADIKQDMQSDRIMDRLVCGDVGFGKTEVAIRAMFRAVLGGKQVAFLCPTTILSQQHYQTVKERLDGFGVSVMVINRFKNKAQQEQILKELHDGKIDIIIGTHRLLSQDVHFKDLGLLVLDEEQRFGVGDKEKIKELKNNIDVLTLSATPIPRTLNMSLTGIRDISIIATPPKERIPIQTYVAEESDALIENACKRELARGGQVLYLYNKVESIYEEKERVQALLPNARIGVAHGQMSERLLEDTIMRLYNKEYDIFISTTIIENGVDLPLANTLIVIDSDHLGLSQLYQLRGRIGRSNRLAYAYFTYNPSKSLTDDAYKRLDAIMEFTGLGSGFKIAMRDLEIRGAGNVLGKEQHGHMQKIGYDLYCKMLEQAVGELKGDKVKTTKPIKLDIMASANISPDYIVSEDDRIKAYTTLSTISSEDEFNKVKADFTEIYGDIPKDTLRLIKIAYLKNLATNCDIKHILINNTSATVTLYENKEIMSKNLVEILSTYNNVSVKLGQTATINFDFGMRAIDDKINFVIEFLKKCNLNQSK